MKGERVVAVAGEFVVLKNGRLFRMRRGDGEVTELPPIPGSPADVRQKEDHRDPSEMLLVGGPHSGKMHQRTEIGWPHYLEFPGDGKRDVYERAPFYIREYRYRSDLGLPEAEDVTDQHDPEAREEQEDTLDGCLDAAEAEVTRPVQMYDLRLVEERIHNELFMLKDSIKALRAEVETPKVEDGPLLVDRLRAWRGTIAPSLGHEELRADLSLVIEMLAAFSLSTVNVHSVERDGHYYLEFNGKEIRLR